MSNLEISYVAIAMFLEKKIERQVIELSKKMCQKYNSWWQLSEDNFPPHITLWLAYIPQKNEEILISDLKSIIKDIKYFLIELDKIEIKDNDKEYYVCLKIKQTNELLKMHNFFLNKLNYIREGYINKKYLDALSKETSEEIKFNIENYGTRFVGKLFDPHISISFIDKVKVIKNDLALELPQLKGIYQCNDIIVFKQKESGKSIDILAKFSLGDKNYTFDNN
jgi:hypothetical protein